MPTTFRRLESEALTIPADVMRQLGWSFATPIDVQCRLAWTDAPSGAVCRCLVFTLTATHPKPRAARSPRTRSLRKAA